MESNHHCILRGDMSYPLNDDPKSPNYSIICYNIEEMIFNSEAELSSFAESLGIFLLNKYQKSPEKPETAETSKTPPELLAPFFSNFDFSKPLVIELVGDVGAGKTTFTRALARGLEISDPVTSPSFSISKRYPFRSGELIHYDFYRLEDPGIMSSELSEALETPGSLIVLEWGDSVKNLLPSTRLSLSFKILSDTARELNLLSLKA